MLFNNEFSEHHNLYNKITKSREEDEIHDLDINFENITRKVKLDVGKKCNAGCFFCYYKSELNSPMKTLGVLKKEIDLMKSMRFEEIELSGGEPTIHPDFIEIIKYIDSIGLKASFVTNAFELNLNVLKELKPYLNDILISIQGYQENHNKILRLPEAYNNILEVIDACNNLDIPVRINTTVHKNNIDNLLYIYEDIKSKVRTWNLIPINYWDDARKLKREMPYEKISEVLEKIYERVMNSVATEFITGVGQKSTPVMLQHNSNQLNLNIRYYPLCKIDPKYKHFVKNYWHQYYDKEDWHPFFMDTKDLISHKQECFIQEVKSCYIRDLLQKRKPYYKDKACLNCPDFIICDGYKP